MFSFPILPDLARLYSGYSRQNILNFWKKCFSSCRSYGDTAAIPGLVSGYVGWGDFWTPTKLKLSWENSFFQPGAPVAADRVQNLWPLLRMGSGCTDQYSDATDRAEQGEGGGEKTTMVATSQSDGFNIVWVRRIDISYLSYERNSHSTIRYKQLSPPSHHLPL